MRRHTLHVSARSLHVTFCARLIPQRDALNADVSGVIAGDHRLDVVHYRSSPSPLKRWARDVEASEDGVEQSAILIDLAHLCCSISSRNQ